MTFGESLLLECRHKIERAKEHSRVLYHELRAFLATQPYAVVPEYDSKQSKYSLKLKIIKPIPHVQFSLIIGDCVHNARAPLDYIAWRLGGSRLRDRSTFFPIHDTEPGFNSAISRGRLDLRIHPDALNAIRDVQPYKRPQPQREHLWLLQELDARDKHKLLTMTQTHSFGGSFTAVSGAEIRIAYGRLNEGAEVASVRFPDGTPESEMKVNAQPLFDVAFEGTVLPSADPLPVNSCLHQIIYRVINVVSQFEELITTNPHWIR